ncbi:MAG: OmpA family protein [Rhodobacteraceae bacterium]|nr:OmpA family protein [Paracoccaceae bacterium]
MRWPAAIVFCLAPGLAGAAPTLALPETATRTVQDIEKMGSYELPVGPWRSGKIETETVEGEVTQTAWRVRETGLTTMALLAPLRDQLAAEGFSVIYECETDVCGGFDFRFATDVLPEPEMHVDLGDFRFLSARRDTGDAAADYVSLLVSRSSDSGYVQMTRIGTAINEPIIEARISPEAIDDAVRSSVSLSESLDLSGSVVLDDLSFPTGSVELGAGDYASLSELSDYLKAHPDRKVALVGHTDAEGSLEANIVLSRSRAQSVRNRLISDFGVNPGQVSADGVGFLSPRASNLTAEGRTENRRVEVMITSTR